MKRVMVVVLALVAAASASELEKKLEEMAQAHRGKVSLYARHMKTGETVAISADEPVQTASVIKLPVMVETFAQVKAGKVSLSDKLTLTDENKVPGSGVLQFLHSGLEVTLEDAVWLMMTLSDNTSTNLVIDAVSIPAVNQRMETMGLKNTVLYKKVYKPAESPVPAEQTKFGLGKTTAREMGAVLESVARCDLGDEKLCQRMVEIMRNQQYRNMLARYIETVDATEYPSGVAAKLGQLDDVRNDVGLVFTRTGTIVISAFTWENEDQRWLPENEAELLIARMAREIVDAWAPDGVKTGEMKPR